MIYGLSPPMFDEPEASRRDWFSSIFRFAQSKTGVTTQTASYVVLWNIFWVRMNATAGARTVTFPLSAANKGRIIGIIKIDASGNAVTATASTGDAINGTAALGSQWSAGLFIADGTTNWDRVT